MNRSLLVLAACASLAPSLTLAATTRLDLAKLQSEAIADGAQRTVLALGEDGRPLSVLLRLSKGQVLPPHGGDGGVRLVTVVSGTLSWGDGVQIAPGAEHRFGPGSVIVVPAEGGEHWAAARQDDVVIQVVRVPPNGLTPAVKAQLVP
jgi:quercetin dioxygenase-like cupin family protein